MYSIATTENCALILVDGKDLSWAVKWHPCIFYPDIGGKYSGDESKIHCSKLFTQMLCLGHFLSFDGFDVLLLPINWKCSQYTQIHCIHDLKIT